ncbi:hypothetical protein ANN_20564 [Periplaneta americana]|uniref:Uncharacterized protein n=1 Tax=Periplaneta americana TaxID=6978 RepID=A0ABQ8SE41_PERAM|nr:hypothetical protein ANN_20564 [Periplaneta americana]
MAGLCEGGDEPPGSLKIHNKAFLYLIEQEEYFSVKFTTPHPAVVMDFLATVGSNVTVSLSLLRFIAPYFTSVLVNLVQADMELSRWFPAETREVAGETQYEKQLSLGLVPKLPRSTPPDFFVWGFVKDIVYSQKDRNIDDLRVKFIQAFQQITLLMLQRTWAELHHRYELCRVRNGGHVEL